MTNPNPNEAQRTADPAQPLAVQVLEFFREHLAEVEFPDVSASILESQVDHLDERQAAVAAARAQLRQAENELDATRTALGQLAERAVAYARVYANGNAGLERALAALDPRPSPRVKPKARKGRDSTKAAAAPAQATLPAPAAAKDSLAAAQPTQGTVISNEMA